MVQCDEGHVGVDRKRDEPHLGQAAGGQRQHGLVQPDPGQGLHREGPRHRDLGLNELYLWPINADQQGSPRQVRAVIDGVREHGIPAVFCESTVSSDPAEQVARETGATFGGILYVDSLSEPDGPVPTYLDLLKVTTETIARGLAPAN